MTGIPLCELSPARRAALLTCLTAGSLYRSNGMWRGKPGSTPVCGVTVADLKRDGLLREEWPNKPRSITAAQLTAQGERYARELAGEMEPAR